jgi:hypothetical protein
MQHIFFLNASRHLKSSYSDFEGCRDSAHRGESGESLKGGPRHHNGALLVLGWRMHLISSIR